MTSRRANLHDEVMTLLVSAGGPRMPAGTSLYASAYRPVRRAEQPEIDLWLRPLALDDVLPTLPLALANDVVVPLDLEATYQDVFRRRIGD